MTSRTALTQTEQYFVHAQRVARLATADGDGRPHLVPVCYAYDRSRFYTPLDEKPKRVSDDALRRVLNIKARPEVALLIDRYDDDWSQLGYLLIQGQATVLQPGEAAHATAITLLRRRYPQYEAMNLESRGVIAITARHVVSWGHLQAADHSDRAYISDSPVVPLHRGEDAASAAGGSPPTPGILADPLQRSVSGESRRAIRFLAFLYLATNT